MATYGRRDDVMIWSVPEGESFSTVDAIPGRWVSDLAFATDSPYAAAIIDNEIFVWEIQSAISTDFYVHAATDSFVGLGPLAIASANDIPELMQPSPGFSGKSLDLDQVAAYLHFPMLVPTNLPGYLSFREAMINDDGSLRLWYEISYPDRSKSSLYILEKVIGESTPPTMTVGSSAEVTLVQVEGTAGQIMAEYVRGDWVQSMSVTDPNGSSTVGDVQSAWRWDPSSTSQRLRWQENAMLIALYYKGDTGYVQVMGDNGSSVGNINNKAIDQLDLVQIANSMRWYHEVRGN